MDKDIKIVIHISGGCLRSVYATPGVAVNVSLIDDDDAEADEIGDEDQEKLFTEAVAGLVEVA